MNKANIRALRFYKAKGDAAGVVACLGMIRRDRVAAWRMTPAVGFGAARRRAFGLGVNRRFAKAGH